MEDTVAVGGGSSMSKKLFKNSNSLFFVKGKEVEFLLSNLECSLYSLIVISF